jgi:hypothetical protein
MVVKEGELKEQYGSVRTYLFNGEYYYIPERLWKVERDDRS